MKEKTKILYNFLSKIWGKTASLASSKYYRLNPNSWYDRFVIFCLFLPTLCFYIFFVKFCGKDAEEEFWKES